MLVRKTQEGDDDLLRYADQTMYQAKHDGRNAVVVASQYGKNEQPSLATT